VLLGWLLDLFFRPLVGRFAAVDRSQACYLIALQRWVTLKPVSGSLLFALTKMHASP